MVGGGGGHGLEVGLEARQARGEGGDCHHWVTHYLRGFLTPPVVGALPLAALVARDFRGALPPVLLLALCFVRAIVFAG